MRRTLLIALLLAAAALSGAATKPRAKGQPVIYPRPPDGRIHAERSIPFVPLPAKAPSTVGLAPCPPRALRPSLFLQGATGSMLGGLRLRNSGRSACALHRPLRLLLIAASGRPLPLEPVFPPSRLTTVGVRELPLSPGRSAGVALQLFNACTAAAGARLWLVLTGGEGRIRLPGGPAGRCDIPSRPPMYSLGGLAAAGPPLLSRAQRLEQQALRLVTIRAPRRARAGTVLRFTVELRNESPRELSLERCPLFYEQLWLYHPDGVVTTDQYFLNCAPLHGLLAAHETVAFAMRVELPRTATGRASLEWGLEAAFSLLAARAPVEDALRGDAEPYSWGAAVVSVTR